MQNTKFRTELIIANDASTDKTNEVIKELISKYKGTIKLTYQNNNENLGMIPNFLEALSKCSGKFIALCEGDDYWTDPYKLQKQIDYLEANADYAICFHRVYELADGKALALSNLNISDKEETYTNEDLAKGNFIHTPSVVFRNGLIKEFSNWFYKSPVGDYPLHMLNANFGKIKYLPEPMAVYRKNEGSVWGTKSREYQITNYIKVIDFLIVEFNNNKNVEHNLNIQKTVLCNELASLYLRANNVELFKKYFLADYKGNDKVLTNWINEEFTQLMFEKEEIRNKLLNIQQSTAYQLLKRLRIFK